MTEVSSVRTSRLASPRVALYAAKSDAGSHKAHSVRSKISTFKSILTDNSALTEVLEELLQVDEYGITDKECRNCQEKLSLVEVLALCVPLNSEGAVDCDISKIKFDEINFICLNCYAE